MPDSPVNRGHSPVYLPSCQAEIPTIGETLPGYSLKSRNWMVDRKGAEIDCIAYIKAILHKEVNEED
jgi:hypothetical protein